jgi:hypothetical protein
MASMATLARNYSNINMLHIDAHRWRRGHL